MRIDSRTFKSRIGRKHAKLYSGGVVPKPDAKAPKPSQAIPLARSSWKPSKNGPKREHKMYFPSVNYDLATPEVSNSTTLSEPVAATNGGMKYVTNIMQTSDDKHKDFLLALNTEMTEEANEFFDRVWVATLTGHARPYHLACFLADVCRLNR